MKVFAVCSLKGGVGKTSVVLGMASAGLQLGLRTLVVDLDPQADATMALDAVLPENHADVADVLDDPQLGVVGNAIVPSAWDEDELVEVMAGSARSGRYDSPDPSPAAIGRLATAIRLVEAHYDLVLIDCPPSLSALTRMGMAAARRAIVVTEPGLFAVAAADRALSAIQELREAGAGVQPLGIVVNRVRSHTREHTFRVQELDAMFGPLVLHPSIPERSAIQQAQGALRPIHSWPGASAADLSGRFDTLLRRAMRAPDSQPRAGAPQPEPSANLNAGTGSGTTAGPGHELAGSPLP